MIFSQKISSFLLENLDISISFHDSIRIYLPISVLSVEDKDLSHFISFANLSSPLQSRSLPEKLFIPQNLPYYYLLTNPWALWSLGSATCCCTPGILASIQELPGPSCGTCGALCGICGTTPCGALWRTPCGTWGMLGWSWGRFWGMPRLGQPFSGQSELFISSRPWKINKYWFFSKKSMSERCWMAILRENEIAFGRRW